ncbi:16719_t:CDS:2 [Gigaspora rosea]|nr:16719_t:CDS:2 [Gigaspora rosea]
MSRFEFKLYIFLGVISVIMFPVIQVIFGNIVTLREAVPQLVYGAQLIFLTVLGIQTHYRFINLIERSYDDKNAPHIIMKIRYFIDMNKVLTLTLFVTGASFLLLGSDVLIKSRPITNSKIARDSYIHLNSYNDNNTDRYIESDKYSPPNEFSLNESTISVSQMLPAVPTPVASPPNSISSNTAPSIALKTQLKRNISLSRDGRMVYGDTKPLGKVGGSEFVAVEKADPSDMPYYLEKSSLEATSQQYSKSNDQDTVKSTHERILVLQRSQDEFNALRMKSQHSSLLNDRDGSVSSSAMRSQQSLLLSDGDRSVSSSIMRSQNSVSLNNENKSASNSVNIFNEDLQVPSALPPHIKRISETASELSYTKRNSETVSYEGSDDGYFYAM